MRNLMFLIWIKSAKDAAAALALIESLAAGEYEVASKGGARIVSANVAGKQFQYELPSGWGSEELTEALRQLYAMLQTGGSDGGAMTDAEIEAYVQDTDQQVTSVARARFAINPTRY